jgi:hypothetical protein
MLDHTQADMAIRAYLDIQKEMGLDPAGGQVVFPDLAETLERLTRKPADALLFGVAADGMPLYLHLRDPRPGPILLTGQKGSGKTRFLKTIVRAAERFSSSPMACFAALTDYPADFDDITDAQSLMGVWEAFQPESAQMLSKLADRVERPSRNSSPILLLIDGLESVLQMSAEAQEDLAYIFTHGPGTLVWPVVTVNAEIAVMLPEWLSYFRTRIFGRIANPRTNEALTFLPGAPLNNLFPGNQFCQRLNSEWIKFWLPSLGEG